MERGQRRAWRGKSGGRKVRVQCGGNGQRVKDGERREEISLRVLGL